MTELDIDAPRPNRRQAAKQATRARVLAAAEALFKAGGYADATIRSIARTMEMSTGAVFANFGSKAEVWTAVFGGPPPSAEVADEIARVLGELPQAIWSLTHVDGRFQVVMSGPGFLIHHSESPFVVTGDSPASALRAAREAVLASAATASERAAA